MLTHCTCSTHGVIANCQPEPSCPTAFNKTLPASINGIRWVQNILKVLGLEICADTIVGDQLLRGISGGQKKRVTSGDQLARLNPKPHMQ